MKKNDESQLVSVEDAAARLGLKPATMRLWSAQRKVASVKLGRRRLIPESEIVRLSAVRARSRRWSGGKRSMSYTPSSRT